MFNFFTNFLKVNRKKSTADLSKGLLVFYVIPYILIKFISKFNIMNALSTEIGYAIFLFAALLIFLFLSITILATLNIIFEKELYSNPNNSLLKKIFLTIFFAFPISIIAHFFLYTILSFKKNSEADKALISSYIFSIIALILIGLFTSQLELQLLQAQLNNKDYSIKAFSDVKTQDYKDILIGRKYELKIPMMLLSGFPKEERRNSDYMKKADYLLTDLKRTCVNCLSHLRKEGNIKAFLVPSNTVVEVVGAFKTENLEYLLVKTFDNKIAEIMKMGFENDVINQSINVNNDESVYDNINNFRIQNKLDLSLCSNDNRDLTSELRLFIKDFELMNEMSIVKYYNKEKKCLWLNFKTMNALLLFKYYGEDWDLWGKLSDPLMDEIYGNELQNFDYDAFIK